MTKNRNIFRYVGGAAFAVLALNSLVSLLPRLIDNPWLYNFIQFFMDLLPFALLAIGLFVGGKGLLVTGAGFCLAFQLLDLVQGWSFHLSNPKYFPTLFLWILVYALLLAAVLSKKHRPQLSFAAAGARFLLTLLSWVMGTGRPTVRGILILLCWLAALISIGLVPLSKKRKAASSKAAASAPLDITDELLQLKSLLDRGILTEEEFAEQKAKLIAKVK